MSRQDEDDWTILREPVAERVRLLETELEQVREKLVSIESLRREVTDMRSQLSIIDQRTMNLLIRTHSTLGFIPSLSWYKRDVLNEERDKNIRKIEKIVDHAGGTLRSNKNAAICE